MFTSLRAGGAIAAAVACAAVPALVATTGPTAAEVFLRIKEAAVGHSTEGHRPVVPTVAVRFVGGRWRVAPGKTLFVLRVYIRANLRGRIRQAWLAIPFDRSGTTNRWRIYNGRNRRTVRVKRTTWAINHFDLGDVGIRAITACESQARNGVGRFEVIFSTPVRIDVLGKAGSGHGDQTASGTTGLNVRAVCFRAPARDRNAGAPPTRAPTPFRVTGAGVQLQRVGRGCPTTVFAKVRVYANKPGKVRFTLRSSSGAKWTRSLQVRFRNSRGKYEAGWDYRLPVKETLTRRYWIEIGGRKVGRSSVLRVRCPRSGRPGGFTN